MASRAQRLLRLLDALHRRQRPVTGAALAGDLQVSLRTLYRDIATLREQGARIDGDPGVGYQMRAGFLLPPLMFSHDELEAVLLGARWVQGHADAELAKAAESALMRIKATLPPALRLAADTSGLFAPGWSSTAASEPWLPLLRHAIRNEERLDMEYVDGSGGTTRRTIWPFAMAFLDPGTRLIAAWCELRTGFRHFRAERVASRAGTGRRFPVRRHTLICRWREKDLMQRSARPAAGG